MGFEEKNGQYTGFDIDLPAQAVSEKWVFKVQFQPNVWDMKETERKRRNHGVPSGMAILPLMNAEREGCL